MADDDKIIRFPGAAGKIPGKAAGKAAAKSSEPVPPTGPDGLSEDQRKAMQIVLSGMPFVAVGIKATPSGADFFTAVHGEASDLRNARDHLAGVIERAMSRKGL